MSAVDEIKERLDIVETISAYVPLKRAGRHYKGLCPFHAEKTPSFVVFPETGTWHCFGACSTGGDIFTFIMRRENLDFQEALELLARRAGIELEPRQPQMQEEERHLERLRAVCAAAAVYFHELLLNHAQAEPARAYLQRRGITPQTIEEFQLGYALDDWGAGQRYLLEKGYPLADIVEAGLVIERQSGGGYYDRFRGRVIIPIADAAGRVVGFGARALDGSPPKYLNSPQTPLFDKGRLLYGLDKARRAIRAAGHVVIVEGYMDVIGAHQHGYTNVVASMGTALTESHLRQLKRYTSTLILALDPDVAGQQATLRGLEQARRSLDREWAPTLGADGQVHYEPRLAADLRILALPAGQDPDEFIRSQPQQWPELVAQALPIIDFYLEQVTRTYDVSSARGKALAVAEIAPLIRELGDDVMRHHYIQLLARRVQVDARVIERQVVKRSGSRAPSRSLQTPPVEATPLPQPVDLEDYCLARLISHPQALSLTSAELDQAGLAGIAAEDFEHVENQALFTLLSRAPAVHGEGAPDEWLPASLRPRWERLRAIASQSAALSIEQAVHDLGNAILSLRMARVERSLSELRDLLAGAQEAADEDAARAYGQLVDARRKQLWLLTKVRHQRTMVGKRGQAMGKGRL